jgi:zinc protease
MGVILVGPIEGRREQIIKTLEKRFGASVIPKRTAKRLPRIFDKPLQGDSKWTTLPFDVKTPTLAFSFRVPEIDHADTAALDLAASILSMGELGRLYQNLFYKTSLVTDVSGGLYVPRDPGMLYFQAELDNVDKLEQAAQKMFEEIVRIKTEGPSEEELERVLTNAESERLYATQSADGVAGRTGFLRFVIEDMDYDQKYLDQLKRVTAAQIKDVINRYCDFRRMSGVCLVAKGQEKTIKLESFSKLAKKFFDPEVSGKAQVTKSKKSAVPYLLGRTPQKIKLSSGATLLYRERPQSHVVSVHAATLGGLRMEIAHPLNSAEADWGTSYMMSLSWTKGTKTHDSNSIAKIVEGSAAGLDGFAGRNTVGLQLTGLGRDWKKLTHLFDDVLMEPLFPENEVNHSRRVAEDAVRGVEDHSSQLCSKLFLETLFEHHPYGRLTTGSIESLAGINSAKLRSYHQAWLRPERLVVSVVGSVGSKEFDRWAQDFDQKLLQMKKSSAPLNLNVAQESPLKAPRWVEKNLGREQLHILVGGMGVQLNHPDRLKIQLLHTLLGGQSGRLFIELREKKSLAYSVAPVSFEGVEPGYIGTYIACSPSKRKEAVEGIQSVHEALAKKGPSPSEVKRAQEYYLGRRAMDLQGDSSLSSYYGLEEVYGLPILTDEQMVKAVQSITAKDIQSVCEKYLIAQNKVTAVVG